MSTIDIPAQVASLRDSFNTGLTRSLAWRREQLQSIKRMLIDNRDVIEDALLHDLGKPAIESHITEVGFLLGEVSHTLKHLKSWTKTRSVGVPLTVQPASASIQPEPLGVVLIIAPWNYPLLLTLSPLVGALAAGNAAVLKPSELAPRTAEVLAALVPVYLDQRAVTVVNGAIPETTALLEQRFDHIFYTGNGAVGRVVMTAAAKHLTPVTLELGGKSPAWVDESANLKQVAKRLVWAKFVNTGQTCVAPDYVIGTTQTLDLLTPYLADAIRDLYGTAIERNPDYGRIINERHFDRLVSYLTDGEVVVGGEVDRSEKYIAPTILRGVKPDAPVMRDEIFGPILPLIDVENLDAAIARVNAGEKPLALYVFSADAATQHRWQRETSSGALGINVALVHLSVADLPFGGVGASGMGNYHGERSFETFSHMKAVLSKPLSPDTLAATVMPPYSATKARLLRKLFS